MYIHSLLLLYPIRYWYSDMNEQVVVAQPVCTRFGSPSPSKCEWYSCIYIRVRWAKKAQLRLIASSVYWKSYYCGIDRSIQQLTGTALSDISSHSKHQLWHQRVLIDDKERKKKIRMKIKLRPTVCHSDTCVCVSHKMMQCQTKNRILPNKIPKFKRNTKQIPLYEQIAGLSNRFFCFSL